MSRTAICNTHDEIMELSRGIYRYAREILNSDDLDQIYGLADKILGASDEAESAALCAKEAGQAMENRLQEYYDAIEGLGFDRRGR